MGDFRPVHSHPPHLYTQHPSAIHSEQYRLGTRAVALGPVPTSLSPSFPIPPQHKEQQPALLLLHPLLQLARLDPPKPVAALSVPYPTVIVSPHPHSPTTARDATRNGVKKSLNTSTLAHTQLDGSNSTALGVHGSAAMTSNNGASTMGGKREERGIQFPRSQRPSMVSQHSNSVPSTPLQTARQYESQSRSPSPNGGLGSHSPRSVSSEANGPLPTLRASRPNRCKYETNAAFGRRRIPYTSSDILDKVKEEPKKTLDPDEDGKLSGDMRELYDRLVPNQENRDRRKALVKKLETILHTEWPENEFKVHVFGSSGNQLYTNESDVDVCIQTPMKRLEEMHMLAEALDKHGMERVVCIPQAKVRIVKVWDPVLKLACDMNVNNMLALENTRMIKTYVQIDDRVRPLAMIIKYWTKQRILNDAAFGGTISSYTWICMILNFLQTRDPPIIPSLHKLPYRKSDDTTGTPSESEFADDIEKLRGFGKDNKESVGQLLFHFFRRYGHELDFEKHVISVREGRLLTREEKDWHLVGLKKEARNRLCVEEPFNTDRNLGNSADDFAWRGIHLEIRRAFDLLADAQQLDKACEQFEFPPEEKVTFKKPTSSKPVLQSAPSGRGGRGGFSHRGGRGNFNQKGNHNHGSGRRASSGASFGANRPPFLNSPPIPTVPGQEYFQIPPRGLNEQLHDQLVQHYLSLEMQSNSLRAQLRAQQAQQVQAAQMHAHALQAQAQAQAHGRGQNSMNGSPQKSPYINGHSSPRLSEVGVQASPLPQQFIYQYPGFYDPSQGHVTVPQDGPRTNPSSPSLNHSVLRRTVHRSSNASDTGSIRSQSQPPRVVPQQNLLPGYAPIPQYFEPSSFAGYPIARSTPEVPASQPASEAPYSPLTAYTETAISSDHSSPKEYVGYYVAEEPQGRPQPQDYVVPQIPSYNELVQRRRRVSSEITQPLLNTALRRVSRSPSPLGGHMRSYSTGVTAPVTNLPHRKDRNDSTLPPLDSGPVIVNGSFPTPPRESRNRSETINAYPSLDPANTTALGIYVNSGDHYQMTSPENRQQLVHEELQRQEAPTLSRSGMANGTLKDASPAEVNVLARVPSAGKNPFPTLPEGWMQYDATNGEKKIHLDDVSPTAVSVPQWQPVQYTNGLPPLDTLNSPRAPPHEIKSAGLPLLSPVFETRTPSPTANRQLDSNKLVNGAKSQSKENHQQHRRASHTPGQTIGKENVRGNQQKNSIHHNEKGSKANGGPNNNNAGNAQNGTKRRNKKGKGAKGGEFKTTGEPLPANAAERKGG